MAPGLETRNVAVTRRYLTEAAEGTVHSGSHFQALREDGQGTAAGTAGHVAPTSGKQRETNAATQLALYV